MELNRLNAFFLALAIVLPILKYYFSHSAKIDTAVQTQLSQSSSVDIIITMRAGTGNVLQKLNNGNVKGMSRESRIKSVTNALELQASKTQQNVLEFLKQSNVVYTSFWISNQIYVVNANEALVRSLAAMDDIGKIEKEHVFPLDEPSFPGPNIGWKVKIPWGIQNIQATQVWAHDKGNSGEGIIVGIIDTGVRLTHAIVRDNYVHNEYGWYDPFDFTLEPNDQQGHGTHVTGTIVGKMGIGVAPNAQWMACKGGDSENVFYLAAVIACGQFMLKPTLPNGTQPDSSKAPHVINNSWGWPAGGQDFYDSVIQAWEAAGIIPVFAIMNKGPLCHTAGSPGDRPKVISVGATTPTNGLAEFSSRGPSSTGTIKPEISAPGLNIFSAGIVNDNAGAYMSGTSMASAHVAGVVALLLSDQPDLTIKQVELYLFNEADKNVEMNGQMCGGVADSTFPNNFYGHGIVDALKSFNKSLEHKNQMGMRKAKSNGNLVTYSEFISLVIFIPVFILN